MNASKPPFPWRAEPSPVGIELFDARRTQIRWNEEVVCEASGAEPRGDRAI
jgi:hypothetical protein